MHAVRHVLAIRIGAGLMASEAVVRPGFVFEPGGRVHLYRVADEGVQSHRGGVLVGTRKADDAGLVEFSADVKVGDRYIAFAYVAGFPVEVRCIGAADEDAVVQAPVGPVEVKHADGQVVAGVYRPRPDPVSVVKDDEPVAASSASRRAPVRSRKAGGGDSAPSKKKPAVARKRPSAARKRVAPKTTAAKGPAAKSKGKGK